MSWSITIIWYDSSQAKCVHPQIWDDPEVTTGDAGEPSHSDPGMSAASILREFGASPSQNYDVHKDRPGPPNDMVVTCGNRYAMTTMVW